MVVELYSARVCPYAQRTQLTLLEKNISYNLTEIDLQNKPDWFLNISPYQKVPVISNGRDRVWESSIINEYLEELFPEPSLMPKEPIKRAIARIWIDFANTKFNMAFYKVLLTQDPEQQAKWKQTLIDHLLFMETEGIGKLSQGGLYWFGDDLTLVDLTFYPWFERWSVIEHYRGLAFPKQCNTLKKWSETMAQRESVKSIANEPNFYLKTYEKYADNTATGITTQEMRDS